MEEILNKINKENDIKNIAPEDYKQLAREIRKKLVVTVGKNGGHLAANLGVVELTMALHLFMDLPKDKLVWDVGHQSYVHKILTGRKDKMSTLRTFGGLSGFPKTHESSCDVIDTGHSSTSISTALGLAKARDLAGTDELVVAVIGDGALSGGMAYEAMNNAAQLHTKMLIVLNDNNMSIAKNVGGMSNYLGKIRTNQAYRDLKINVEAALDKIPNLGQPIVRKIKKAKNSLKQLLVPGMLFEDMGIIYIGPVDGHDINAILTALKSAEDIKDQPVLVHVITKKGKGFKPAEAKPDVFHGIGGFDLKTGKPLEPKEKTYTDVFSKWLLDRGEKYKKIVSICAAMPDGTGVKEFADKFPNRSFDVGIAEEHAVTFAAGLATGGQLPIVSLYSTFLQRAYDQILHDVCINNLPVIFAVDRSGIVGKDGETHQGIYDISFLSTIPNMTILSPMDEKELENSFDFALEYKRPIAIRYPRGRAYENQIDHKDFEYGKAEIIYQSPLIRDGSLENKDIENKFLFLAVGNMVKTGLEVAKEMEKEGISTTVVNMRFVKPFDKETIKKLAKSHTRIITIEDNIYSGGFGQAVEAYLFEQGIEKKVDVISFPDIFVEHGASRILYDKYNLSPEKIYEKLK